jgi:hypothetical protein
MNLRLLLSARAWKKILQEKEIKLLGPRYRCIIQLHNLQFMNTTTLGARDCKKLGMRLYLQKVR